MEAPWENTKYPQKLTDPSEELVEIIRVEPHEKTECV